MKRRLRTVLDLLHPGLVEDRKRRNEEFLDKSLSKGTVIEKTGPLSYKTVTPDVKSIRCHIDQVRNRKTPLGSSQSSPESPENSISPAASSAIPSSTNTPIKPSDTPAEIETPKKAPDESHRNQPL
ncbi:hypothetical protein AVEN_194515-1 [Araneus ventricosus]|uniref:Uncharacterized protein n=1 Tax=Araneus ventricosus TaxID=182803 RepID=A0A4Y2A8P3_ARAVE|nr:hypothetical protein AVEN_194515-1 [Araneus ventricosus]